MHYLILHSIKILFYDFLFLLYFMLIYGTILNYIIYISRYYLIQYNLIKLDIYNILWSIYLYTYVLWITAQIICRIPELIDISDFLASCKSKTCFLFSSELQVRVFTDTASSICSADSCFSAAHHDIVLN